MAKKKIFISHSAHRDPTARPALNAIEKKLKALDKDYSILLDHSTLKPGEDWRSTINVWCGGCDAAILLVTPDSMVADYCVYEWSILSYRKAMSKNFGILPVYLGTKPEDLRGKPHQLAEIQGVDKGVPYTTIETIWPYIEEWLQTVVPMDSPSTMQAYLIANLLRANLTDPNFRELNRALEEIELEMGTWEPLKDRWEQFAFLLLGIGLQKAAPALAQLYPSFDRKDKDWLDLLDLIACSWVDYRSVELLRQRTRSQLGHRIVGLNADQGETARLYVVRASDVRPSGTWVRADVSAVVQNREGLENQIARSLAEALTLTTSPVDRPKLEAKLQNRELNKQPSVVYLRTKSLSQEWLAYLRNKFPWVTFFLLAGEDQPVFEEVEWLEPKLETNFEARFWNGYESTKDVFTS